LLKAIVVPRRAADTALVRTMHTRVRIVVASVSCLALAVAVCFATGGLRHSFQRVFSEAPEEDLAVNATARRAHEGRVRLPSECPGVEGVRLPCFPRDSLVFFLHIPKTGGRTVATRLHDLTGLRRCGRFPFNGVGSSLWVRASNLLVEHREELLRKPCFTAYETTEPQMRAAFREANLTPVVITMLREFASRTLSAIEHDRARRRNKGLHEVRLRDPAERYQGYAYADYPIAYLGDEPLNFLENSLFGVSEYMEATFCLWEFQLGSTPLRKSCDCKSRPVDTKKKIGVAPNRTPARVVIG